MKSNPFAQELRTYQTEAENRFWGVVKNRQFENLKFRRQVSFGRYILDFVCFELKLVVEIDGGQHNENISDMIRDNFLKSEGFLVKRFWNNEVLGNLEGVMADLSVFIASMKNTPHPNPLPQGARE